MKKVLIGLSGVAVLAAVGIGGFVAVVAAQPTEMHVERSLVVAAAPEDVYPLVSDLRAFVTWSPWTDLDPDQKTEFSDPSAGAGAWYTWAGNEDVGRGKMSIRSVEENVEVVEDLEFIEPFESKAVVTMTLAPEGDGTRVTWAMDSEHDFIGKAFSLFVDMDAMLGADFEKGLASLGVAAQRAAEDRAVAAKAAEAEAAAKAAAEAEAAAAVAAP